VTIAVMSFLSFRTPQNLHVSSALSSEPEREVVTHAILHVVGTGNRPNVSQVVADADLGLGEIAVRVDQSAVLFRGLRLLAIDKRAMDNVRQGRRISLPEWRLHLAICFIQHLHADERVMFGIHIDLRVRTWVRVGRDRMIGDEQRLAGLSVREDVSLGQLVDLDDGAVPFLINEEKMDTHSDLNDAIAENRFLGLFNSRSGVEYMTAQLNVGQAIDLPPGDGACTLAVSSRIGKDRKVEPFVIDTIDKRRHEILTAYEDRPVPGIGADFENMRTRVETVSTLWWRFAQQSTPEWQATHVMVTSGEDAFASFALLNRENARRTGAVREMRAFRYIIPVAGQTGGVMDAVVFR
jgi:hypothetical protein